MRHGHRAGVLTATGLLALGSLTGCSEDLAGQGPVTSSVEDRAYEGASSDGPTPIGGAPSDGPTPSTTEAVGMAPTPAEGGEAAAGVPPTVVSTAVRTSQAPEELVRLVGVETARTSDAETVRFRTAGGTPGYTVRYVDAVRVEGEPVLVEGDDFLEVVLESADPQGEQGLSPEVAVSELVDQELVQEVRFARYVDGQVTFAIGLSGEAAFSIVADADGLTIVFPR